MEESSSNTKRQTKKDPKTPVLGEITKKIANLKNVKTPKLVSKTKQPPQPLTCAYWKRINSGKPCLFLDWKAILQLFWSQPYSNSLHNLCGCQDLALEFIWFSTKFGIPKISADFEIVNKALWKFQMRLGNKLCHGHTVKLPTHPLHLEKSLHLLKLRKPSPYRSYIKACTSHTHLDSLLRIINTDDDFRYHSLILAATHAIREYKKQLNNTTKTSSKNHLPPIGSLKQHIPCAFWKQNEVLETHLFIDWKVITNLYVLQSNIHKTNCASRIHIMMEIIIWATKLPTPKSKLEITHLNKLIKKYQQELAYSFALNTKVALPRHISRLKSALDSVQLSDFPLPTNNSLIRMKNCNDEDVLATFYLNAIAEIESHKRKIQTEKTSNQNDTNQQNDIINTKSSVDDAGTTSLPPLIPNCDPVSDKDEEKLDEIEISKPTLPTTKPTSPTVTPTAPTKRPTPPPKPAKPPTVCSNISVPRPRRLRFAPTVFQTLPPSHFADDISVFSSDDSEDSDLTSLGSPQHRRNSTTDQVPRVNTGPTRVSLDPRGPSMGNSQINLPGSNQLRDLRHINSHNNFSIVINNNSNFHRPVRAPQPPQMLREILRQFQPRQHPRQRNFRHSNNPNFLFFRPVRRNMGTHRSRRA